MPGQAQAFFRDPAAAAWRFAGFGQALDIARDSQADFLLMYDSNHQNRGMALYPLEEQALDMARAKGVKHIFLELFRDFQPYVDARANGTMGHAAFVQAMSESLFLMRMEENARLPQDAEVEIVVNNNVSVVRDPEGRAEYLNRLSRGIVMAAARGIRIWGADSGQYMDERRLTHHDRGVAALIAEKSRGGLSIVTYGGMHGGLAKRGDRRIPGGGLDDELARHGRVMTLELQEMTRPDQTTVLGREVAVGRGQYLLGTDRSPLTLNIQTGELRRDPHIDNSYLRGRPRGNGGAHTRTIRRTP